jgi:adenylate kinase
VVDIAVPEAELIRRLLSRMVCEDCGLTAGGLDGRDDPGQSCRRCGGLLVTRSDDNKAVVLERLKIYLKQTKPLVDYYKTRPTFRSVNGSQPPDQVAADLVEAIKSAANGMATQAER